MRKWGPTGIAGGSSCALVRLSYQPRPSRRMYDLTSAFLLPATRKRASGLRDAQLFSDFILGQLIPDVLGYLCLILAHRVDIITTAPELLRYLNFSSPNCSYIIRLLFPFKYPTNADTLILGSISSNIWIWSGQHSASTMPTPFHTHSFRNLSSMPLFFSP